MRSTNALAGSVTHETSLGALHLSQRAPSANAAAAVATCTQCLYADCSRGDDTPGLSSPLSPAHLCASCRQWSIRRDVLGFPGRCMVAACDLEADVLILQDELGMAADIRTGERNEQRAAAADDSEPAAAASSASAAPALSLSSETAPLCAAYVSLLRDLISFGTPSVSTPSDLPCSRGDVTMASAFRYWSGQLCSLPVEEFEQSNTADGEISGSKLLEAARKLHQQMSHTLSLSGAEPALLAAFPPSDEFALGMTRVKLNCWQIAPASASDSPRLLVPLQIASINHSCCPNAILLNGCQLYTAKRILSGDQIFISYLTPKALLENDTAERQRLLKRNWHFECACQRCNSSSSNSSSSEVARTEGNVTAEADAAAAADDAAWNAELEEAWIYHDMHPDYEAVCVDQQEEEEEEEEREDDDDQADAEPQDK